MIFKQIDEIVTGRKTQTRRIVKEGEIECVVPLVGDRRFFKDNKMYVAYPAEEVREITRVEINGRLKWQVGDTYAVVPGRGKPGVMWLGDGRFVTYPADCPLSVEEWQDKHMVVGWRFLRIRITAIRQERLQEISEEDAISEGIKSIAPKQEDFPKKHLYPWANGEPAYYDYLTTNWHTKKDEFCCCNEGKDAHRLPAICSYKSLWDSIDTRKGTQWANNPLVWALTFEVVRT